MRNNVENQAANPLDKTRFDDNHVDASNLNEEIMGDIKRKRQTSLPDFHIKKLLGNHYEFSEKYLLSEIDPNLIKSCLK
jgi:hypothetical protein